MPTIKSTERGRSAPRTRLVATRTLKDTAPPSLIHLQNAIKNARWEVNAKVLDLVALVCGSEQTWRIARGQLLTLFNNEDKTERLIFGQYEMTSQETAVETEEANDDESS